MIVELPKETSPQVRHLLHGFHHYVAIAAILDGRLPGRVWVDRLEDPATLLLWDMVNAMFYLAGDPTDVVLNRQFNELITNTICPEAVRSGYRRFFLQVTPRAWEERLGALLDGRTFGRTSILCFARDPAQAERTRKGLSGVPAGCEVARITGELLNCRGWGISTR